MAKVPAPKKLKIQVGKHWFHGKSKKAQLEYIKKHPNSVYAKQVHAKIAAEKAKTPDQKLSDRYREANKKLLKAQREVELNRNAYRMMGRVGKKPTASQLTYQKKRHTELMAKVRSADRQVKKICALMQAQGH